MQKSKVKILIKNRDLSYFKKEIVDSSSHDDLSSILKSVSYFRNFSIFKSLYTLLYKSNSLTLDQYRDLFKSLREYKDSHPKDYFLEGFSLALKRSKTSEEVKAIYANLIYNHLFESNLFNKYSNRVLKKSISDYYTNDKNINLAIIKKSKVYKINNGNLVKIIRKWNR